MKVKRQWRGILTGFAAGVLVMLLAGRIAGVYNREPEQNAGERQEEGQEAGAVDREEMQAPTGKETKLILMDIFREGILYKEISRDYSKMADPILAIESIEVLESGDIQLQYYGGDDMELVSEIIEIL